MNQCIKKLKLQLASQPKLRAWLWFIGLWLAGFIAVNLLTLPIKLLFIPLLK